MTIAILPAAGESHRMRRRKLLLPFGDTTVVGAVVSALHAGGVDRIVIVLAPADSDLRAWAAGAGSLEIVENPAPERGMLSSVQEGIRALGGATAVAAAARPLLVTPADLPSLQPSTVRRVIAAVAESAAPLAVPTYRGKRGHPIAIAPSLAHDIARLDAAIGLRQLLDRHPVLEIAVDDAGTVIDVDTPADYERLLGSSSAPTRRA